MNIFCHKNINTLFFFLACNVIFGQNLLKNGAFENKKIKSESKIVKKLNGWKVTNGNVEFISNTIFSSTDKNLVLDLNGNQPGAISQTIKGLKKNSNYTLKFAYADQKNRNRDISGTLATAEVFVNDKKLTTLRNLSPAPNYINGIGFAFKSSSKGVAKIEFVSTTKGKMGLVIDNVNVKEGLPLEPPVNNHLVNGSFEMKVDSEDSNPHLFGEQLPGWLIMKENVDIIAIDNYGTPHGKWIIDLGGHGPGGIAQTINNLTPGANYRLSFLYSRHRYWNQEDPLTGKVFLNDNLVLNLSRNKNYKAPRWEKITYDFIVPPNGQVTLSMFSTALKVGGGILYDNIQIEKVTDIVKPKKIPVLIIDGFSNHHWQLNTKYLQKILESSGKFTVSVSTCPNKEKNNAAWEDWNPNFSNYPVVIQTCNNINKESSLQWPEEVKKSFEEYVKKGGGVYMYHGATNAFKSWDAYNEMIGLGWRKKDFGIALTIDENEKITVIPKGEGENTGHGPRRNALITRIGQHPIHIGMPKKWIAADIEVYRYGRGTEKNLEVLSYAKDEKTGLNFPIEWTVKYGEGKVYSSTYGHLWHNQKQPPSMECVAFHQSMIRALQWLSNNKAENYVPQNFPIEERFSLKKVIVQE